MAHLAKFSGGVEGAKMYAHWTREIDDQGCPITYAKEHGGAGHIDRNLTAKNYTLGIIHDREWIRDRLKYVYQKPGQKRPIESCDIIVTLPQSESRDEENVKAFMLAAYDSLARQYGTRNNIIGAWVHMDEAQPHMHFAFLPISPRKSKQKPEYTEKLAVHDYWPRKNSLQLMHKQLQKDIDAALGRHVDGINNGITKEQGGNKTITQLKAESIALQKRIEKCAQASAEEMELLKGKHVDPMLIGAEHYKLSPQQYARYRRLAESSIEARSEYEHMRDENTRLENENLDMKRRMQRYILEARAQSEKEVRDKLTAIEKERDSEQMKVYEISTAAESFLNVPEEYRDLVAMRYIERAQLDFQLVAHEVLRATATAYIKLGNNAMNTIKLMAPALRAIDTRNEIRSFNDWVHFVRRIGDEARRQVCGEKQPPKDEMRASDGWSLPNPSHVDFLRSLEHIQRLMQIWLDDEELLAVTKAHSMPMKKITPEKQHGRSM